MSTGNSPAFPCQDNKKQIWTGMNLRDYIAMEALHAIIDHHGFVTSIDEDIDKARAQGVAYNAYLVANAMLEERTKYP
jgi:hypothetical protein